MFTLANKNRALQRCLIFLGIAVLVAASGLIYEVFSHGIWSWYMVLAFLFPLGGALLWGLQHLIGKSLAKSRSFCFFSDAAIATATLGFLLRGALDIYGTEVDYLQTYFWAAGILAGLAAISLLVKIIKKDFG